MSEIVKQPKPISRLAQAKLEEALDLAAQISEDAYAKSTQRAYQSDWRQFEQYCQEVEQSPLPASTATLLAFLATQTKRGMAPSTVQRRLVSIRLVHIGNKLPWPDADAEVARLMKGTRNRWNKPLNKKAPAVDDQIKRMADAVDPETAKGLRDRALLLFGFAAALRRSEIVGIKIEHLIEDTKGILLTIPKSKTDQESKGQIIAIPKQADSEYCPVLAMNDWLIVTDLSEGYVFLRMHRGDSIGKKPMSDQSVALLVKEHARRVGLDPRQYSGHSLRRGFLTSGAANRADLLKLAAQSRHRSLETVREYIDEQNKFEDHAGQKLLK